MNQEQIIKMTAQKHIKIYKLSQLNVPNKEIAALLGTNVGHVYNVLKNYKERPERAEKANTIEL